MERCLRKSTAYGLERGFGPAAMIESAASVAGGGSQRDEGSQPLHYTPYWVYEEPNGEGQNRNSGLHCNLDSS
jgi:hypothetical protein